MASLKEIRQRITTVKSTRQITSAMKMVAAAKLKRSQDAIIQIRPYASRLQEMIGQVSAAVSDGELSPLTAGREPEKILLVAISSNRGLCGGFNSNIARAVVERINARYASQWGKGNLQVLIIGKKAGEILKNKGFGKWQNKNQLVEKPTYVQAEEMADRLMDAFIKEEYSRIELIYNQFRNAASQAVTVERFLPVAPAAKQQQSGRYFNFIFEPNLEDLVRRLIPEALRIQFYKALLDSLASEYGARMTAMHQATDNATEIIRNLTLEYNKARQASITNELIEIVSGAEALKS